MASDSRVTADNTIFTNKHRKIFRLKDGSLLGTAGDADDSDLPNLFNRIKKIPTHKQLTNLGFEFQCIFVKPDSTVYVLESSLEEDTKIYKSSVYPINEPYVAVGSGSSWAMGALAMGASAEQAIKIAIKFDTNCGGAVQLESINE